MPALSDYVVTDRRAVVAYPESGGMTVRTVPLGLFRTMQLTRRPDSSGTIRPGTDTPGPTHALGHYTPPFDLENVPDVDDAVDHIRALLAADGALRLDEVGDLATDADAPDGEDGVEDGARANLRRRAGA